MNKRLREILARKAEIKQKLEGNEKGLDLSALEAEIKGLNQEEEELRKKEAIAQEINKGNTANVVSRGKPAEEQNRAGSIYDSMEYRLAFMDHVTKRKAMPAQYRDNTLTSDIGAVVPPVTLNRIIEKVEAYGMILPLVTRTAYASGMAIPTSDVKPVATWVNEGATSTLQKKTVGSITFSHFKLRCAVSVSLESEYMSLSAFETALVNNISEAMAKALEAAIVAGTGTNQPTGVLADVSKASGNFALNKLTYKDLVSAEAALPMEYEANAVWVMTKKTFGEFIGMTDTAGQPIARVNYGISGTPERMLLGRRVVLTNYLPSFTDSLTTTDVFAFIYDFSDYILNTNLQIGMKTYEDNETDDIVRKSIMVVDGKPVDMSSLVVMTGKVSK